MNLFHRKSAILIVLSWAMLIAAAACWFTGWWWGIFLPLAGFAFCRTALPTPKNNSSQPIPVWISLLSSVAVIAAMMASQEFHFVHLDLDALWNHRGNWRFVISFIALISQRLLLDWRYFSRVPSEDIERFIGEKTT